jgi:hypothetical protein
MPWPDLNTSGFSVRAVVRAGSRPCAPVLSLRPTPSKTPGQALAPVRSTQRLHVNFKLQHGAHTQLSTTTNFVPHAFTLWTGACVPTIRLTTE